MKLAFCLFKYFPFGGLQRDFLKIAQESVKRGHEVHVFTTEWQGESQPGIIIHLLNVPGLQNHTRCKAYSKILEKKLAMYQFDLIVGFNKLPNLHVYFAGDVCYQTRAKNKSTWYRFLPRYRLWSKFEKAVFEQGHGTKILFLSPQQKKDYQICYGTEEERFFLLPPGIDKNRCAPSNAREIRTEKRKSLNISDDDYYLLMVGSGFKTKGVDRSLNSFALLESALQKKCHLKIIGHGNQKSFVRLAKKLKINHRVEFLGPSHEVRDHLLAADILLHPSYHETTGNVLLEALVAGLPILTIDVCGYAMYVQQSNAGRVLASPYSTVAMCQTLSQMLKSNQLATWRENALHFTKTADIYSMPVKAVDYIETFGSQT